MTMSDQDAETDKAIKDLRAVWMERWRLEAAQRHGLPLDVADRLAGDTAIEIEKAARRAATPTPPSVEAALLTRELNRGEATVTAAHTIGPRPYVPKPYRRPGNYREAAPLQPRIRQDLPTSFDQSPETDKEPK